MKRPSRARDSKSATDILEEAAGLLRSRPLILAPYYFGSLPFILGLLYFWTDMSSGANAWRHCSRAAWGLTLLFIWMKTWQSVYARRVLAALRGESGFPLDLRRILRTAAVQTAIQPWGIVILPIAFVILLPFPQAQAFFQNAALMGSGDEGNTRTVIRKSWRLASLWPKQNTLIIWLTSPFLLIVAAFFAFVVVPISSSLNPGAPILVLLLIAALVCVPLCPLGMITALNIGMTLYFIPLLLKTLFDIETLFSLSGFHVMNYTFFAVVCSLSYLCLDPLLKASYCLRCFYGDSLRTGEDLAVELLFLRGGKRAALILFALFAFLGASFGAFPAEATSVPVSPHSPGVPAGQLDSAIGRIIQYPEYAWRMPREKPPENEARHGPFYEFLDSIAGLLGKGWSYVKGGLTKVWDFIKDLLLKIRPSLPEMERPQTHWTSISRALIVIPLVCAIALLAWLAWRFRRRRRPRTVIAEVAVKTAPDITREDVDAAALPEEGWLRMARDLMEKGDLRLALRALYLATLASLARQELITIAKYKSDREYEMELRRRSHARPQVAGVFAEIRILFESAWYGLHEVTPAMMQQFSRNRERIVIDVEG